MAASGIERTPITKDERDFATAVMADMGEEIKCLEWINKKKRGRVEDRLLVISRFRLVTLKVGTMAKAVARNGHLLELKRLIVSEDGNTLDMKFQGFDLDFSSGGATAIIRALMTSYRGMTFGREDRSDIQIPDHVRAQLALEDEPDGPNGVDAFVRALEGNINRAGGTMQRSTELQVRSNFLAGNTSLEVQGVIEPEMAAVFECLEGNPFSFVNIHDVRGASGSASVVAPLGAFVESTTSLQHLELVNVGVSKDGMQVLSRALLANSSLPLEVIDLSGNPLGDKGLGMLSRAVAELPSLRSLAICGCNGSAKSMKDLFSTLEGSVNMGQLETLRVSDNELGRKGSEGLIRLLTSASVPSLRHLGVSNCQVECQALFEAVGNENTPLSSLDISNTRCRREDAVTLCAALATGSSMSDINLAGSGLEPRLLEAIAAALMFNNNLECTGITLSQHDLGSHVGVKIGCMISLSRLLSSLALDDCNLGDEACSTIATAMVESPFCRIERLSLACNVRVGENSRSAVAFGRLLSERQNMALRELNLAGGGDAKPTFRFDLGPVFAALEVNTTLASLDVSGNSLGDAGVTAMCNGLKRNATLQHLNCTDNNFTHSTFRTLLHCLNFNRGLKRIDNISARPADAAEASRIMEIQVQVQDALHTNCQRAATRRGR